MKGRMKKIVPLAVALAVGSAGQAAAASFSDVISTNSVDVGAGQRTFDLTMNGATVTSAGASFNDNNANGIFDAGDTLANSVHIFNRYGVQVLGSGPASIGWTPAQLDQWALNNALFILEALFPAGISEITGATDDDMMVSATVSENLFKKATPARKAKEGSAHELTQEVRAEVEYIDLKVGEDDGSAYGMILGYANEGDSGLDFTLTVPYRFSEMKDDTSSESHFVGLDLALKYPVAKWEKSELTLGGSLFGSAYYMESTAIDKSGNLKYGAGLFSAVNTDLGFGTLGVGLDYRYAKAYLPSSMNSDNVFLARVVDYINDLDPVHTVSYGFNFGVPVGETAAVNLEVIRASFISSDVPDGQENRTTVGLSGTYFPTDTFELNLGLRSDFELEDVDSYGVMLGVVHKF